MAELIISARETIRVGKETVIFGESPKGRFVTVFEDDGETGYFYALDEQTAENKICDALYIYKVNDVLDQEKPSTIEIGWSEDGLKAVLLINNFPHAIFDFEAKRGYCRTNFPPPNENWTKFDHQWSDDALDLFK